MSQFNFPSGPKGFNQLQQFQSPQMQQGSQQDLKQILGFGQEGQTGFGQLAKAAFHDLGQLQGAEKKRAELAGGAFSNLQKELESAPGRMDAVTEQNAKLLAEQAKKMEEQGAARFQEFINFRDTQLAEAQERAQQANLEADQALTTFQDAVDNFEDTVPQEMAAFNSALSRRIDTQEKEILARTQPGPERSAMLAEVRNRGQESITQAMASMAGRFQKDMAQLQIASGQAGLQTAQIKAGTAAGLSGFASNLGSQTLAASQQEQRSLEVATQAQQMVANLRTANELTKTRLQLEGNVQLAQLAATAVESPVSVFETMSALASLAVQPGVGRLRAINPQTGEFAQGPKRRPGGRYVSTKDIPKLANFFRADEIKNLPGPFNQPVGA